MSSEKYAKGEIMQSSIASCMGPLSGIREAASQPSVICKSRGYIGAMKRKFIGVISFLGLEATSGLTQAGRLREGQSLENKEVDYES